MIGDVKVSKDEKSSISCVYNGFHPIFCGDYSILYPHCSTNIFRFPNIMWEREICICEDYLHGSFLLFQSGLMIILRGQDR